MLNEAQFILHGWLRSGNCSSSRGVVEFLEERQVSYIVVARMTQWLKSAARRINDWRHLDDYYSVGEFELQLYGWTRARRFVVIRERVREKKGAVGRKLFDIPGYTFRIFVTNCTRAPEEIWRDYNKRAEIENRIGELKHDLAADDFCMRQFYAAEAAFMAILMLFNLLGELQRMTDMKKYRRPATLRAQLFLCGAMLGRKARRQVLRLSRDWGRVRKEKLAHGKDLSLCFSNFAEVGRRPVRTFRALRPK